MVITTTSGQKAKGYYSRRVDRERERQKHTDSRIKRRNKQAKHKEAQHVVSHKETSVTMYQEVQDKQREINRLEHEHAKKDAELRRKDAMIIGMEEQLVEYSCTVDQHRATIKWLTAAVLFMVGMYMGLVAVKLWQEWSL